MNRWECQAPGCPSVAVGGGGGIGLRAIGWWTAPGPVALCPAHRPDAVTCRDEPSMQCHACAGDVAAHRLQLIIASADNDRSTLKTMMELAVQAP